MRRRARGFTLLEVLIALAILALSTAAVMRQTQLGVRQQQRLELKTYAMWIADDELSGIHAQPGWPPIGRTERQLTLHDQEWTLITDVQSTPAPDMRKIVVRVNLASAGNEGALVTFTAYRGQY